MGLLKEVLTIARLLLGRIFGRATDAGMKKAEEGRRDNRIQNESEKIVEEAHKTNDLDDIRRRASE